MSVGEERKERDEGLRKKAHVAQEFLELTQRIAMAVDGDRWEEVHALLETRQRLIEEMERGEIDMEGEAVRNALLPAVELDRHTMGKVVLLQKAVGDELKTIRRLKQSVHAYGRQEAIDSRFMDMRR